MGPNGEAQYVVTDLTQACLVLFHHYDLTYKQRGESSVRRTSTIDPVERDITQFPHAPDNANPSALNTVGDIFSDALNPQRKRPFDIRSVMRAVIDQDHPPLERWTYMRDAESTVVWDAHVGGIPACFIGIESRPLQRLGWVPGDGPEIWSGGTLFPISSKKVSRAINTASNNRPLVILANLSGFDGSPESMRRLQLEYGAEIARSIVNFVGPIVMCVIARYHGGAYVVFSKKLNPNMEVAAVSGSFASVIGGAPAAAVVLSAEVRNLVHAEPTIKSLREALNAAPGPEKAGLRNQLTQRYREVFRQKQIEVANSFDKTHSVERAEHVNSIDRIIPAETVRPYIIDAIKRLSTRSEKF